MFYSERFLLNLCLDTWSVQGNTGQKEMFQCGITTTPSLSLITKSRYQKCFYHPNISSRIYFFPKIILTHLDYYSFLTCKLIRLILYSSAILCLIKSFFLNCEITFFSHLECLYFKRGIQRYNCGYDSVIDLQGLRL